MSHLLSLLLDGKTVAAVLGYALGAWSWPKLSGKVAAAETAVKAVEQDAKKL